MFILSYFLNRAFDKENCHEKFIFIHGLLKRNEKILTTKITLSQVFRPAWKLF